MVKVTADIANRFGKALYEIVSDDKESLKSIQSQLEKVALLSQAELGRFFANPVFENKEKVKLLEEVSKKLSIEAKVLEFLKVVVKQGYFSFMPEVVSALNEAVLESRNEVQAVVHSAFPLKEKQEKEIEQTLSQKTGKKVLLNINVDPSLLGGVRAHVGSIVYDASVAGQLQRMQEEL